MRKMAILFIKIIIAGMVIAFVFACIPFEGTLAEVREKAGGGGPDLFGGIWDGSDDYTIVANSKVFKLVKTSLPDKEYQYGSYNASGNNVELTINYLDPAMFGKETGWLSYAEFQNKHLDIYCPKKQNGTISMEPLSGDTIFIIGGKTFVKRGEGGGVTVPKLTTLSEVEEYLKNHADGNIQSKAILLSLELYLGTMTDAGSNWQQLLNIIGKYEKFVYLNLSKCTMSGNIFNPKKSVATGEPYIVSLVLPEVALSIEAGTEEIVLGYPVIHSTFELFENLSSIGGAEITAINQRAFYGRYVEAESKWKSPLINVSFPKARDIYKEAFKLCTSLVTISLPRVISIGESAFYQCSSLDNVRFEWVDSIGDYTFYQCRQLQNAEFPIVRYIGESAFNECGALATGIDFSEVITIGDSAFAHCSNLSNIDFPKVETIGGRAFISCWGLDRVDFPLLEEIPGEAFSGCGNLTDINFPKVETIGIRAFSICNKLEGVSFPELTFISDNAFDNCTNLNNLDLPKIEEIGEAAFVFCTSLTMIDLKVEKIGRNAFQNTSLSSINLPNVNNIGNSVFSYTGKNDMVVTFGVNAPVVGSSLFYEGYYKTVTVRHPDNASYDDDWKNAIRYGQNYITIDFEPF